MDADNIDNPVEAGLGFAVKLDRPSGFIGRDALGAIKAAGVPRRRMLQFLLRDPEPLMWGSKIILLEGRPVGCIHVGAYGHS